MSDLMHIYADSHGLTVAYPLWAGLTFLLIALALAVYELRGGPRPKRRWVSMLAIGLATWAGVYFATYRATLTDEAGSVYAFMRYDAQVRWSDALDVFLEHRAGARNWRIVVIDKSRKRFEFDVADMHPEQRDRLMAFMIDRVPIQHVKRAPALLKREASSGVRAVGAIHDGQI